MLARDLSLTATRPNDALVRDDLECVPMAAAGEVAAVRDWLLACSANDMTGVPYRTTPGNAAVDGWFGAATWAVRALAAYRLIRGSVGSADRLKIDGWFLRVADYHRRHLNDSKYGIANQFPNRLAGDYKTRLGPAATGEMSAKRYTASSAPISVLALYFNNRRAALALMAGLSGCWLGDSTLVADSARYVREWLTYSVTAEGYQGEWARNGDYGYSSAGLAYGCTNSATALVLADEMHKLGDDSLLRFATTDGLFGTASVEPKTIWTAVDLHCSMLCGSIALTGMDGKPIDAEGHSSAGINMHASWFLPQARAWVRSAALDAWLAKPRTGRQEDPYGPWRGVGGIYVDVRAA